jgi:V8-like Glu-specific endopeptidase
MFSAARFMGVLVVAGALVNTSVLIARGEPLVPRVDGRVDPLDWAAAEPWIEGGGELFWRKEYRPFAATDYLRLHIKVEALPDEIEGSLRLRGIDGQDITYSTAELRERTEFWSGIIDGGFIGVFFSATKEPKGARIRFDQIAYQAAPEKRFYSTWGGVDDKRRINHSSVPSIVHTVADPVARLRFMKGGRPRVCTGVLIGRDALITNQHCIDSAEICESLEAKFGYEYDKEGKLHLGQKYDCKSFDPAKSNEKLDVSIIQMKGNPGDTWGTIDLATFEPGDNDPLFVIQHPDGKVKMVAVMDCRILTAVVDGYAHHTDFTHTCDTEGGSSGSPVFDKSGRLIGIHHFGFKEGSVLGWKENRGVRISKILEWLGD